MNKLLTKIVGVALGASLAVGVGVAVASNTGTVPAHAVVVTDSFNTFASSSFTGSGNAGPYTASGDVASLVLEKNESSATAWRSSDSDHVRVYAKWKGTVSAGSNPITEITFNVVSGYADDLDGATWTNSSSRSGGTTTSTSLVVTPTSNATSVSFILANQTRIKSVVVKYDNGSQQADPSLSVSPESVVVVKDGTANLTATPADGTGDVSWVSNETSIATVGTPTGDNNKNVTVTGVARGKTTVTASYSTANPVDVPVTVTDVQHNGTAADPYTVEDARDQIDLNVGLTDVYVTGIVSEIVTAYDSTYHNISYNISTDGLTTSEQLEAYRGKGIGGANFTSDEDIQVGDEVVVYGTLKKYGSTYEFDSGNQLVSLNRPVLELNDVTISGTAQATLNGSWDFSGLTVTGTSVGGTAGDMGDITSDCVLTSSASTASAGNTTITVHVNYKSGEKEFDIDDVSATIRSVASYSDTLTVANTGATSGSNSYATWSGKTAAAPHSDAIYAGNSAGEHGDIQLRSNNSNSGIVSTTSGGDLKSVTINFDATNTAATRTVTVYGSTTAYSQATDLYASNTQGTSLGEVNIDNGASQTITVSGDYQYVGIRSKSGALYLSSIVVVWEQTIQQKTLESLSVTTNPTKMSYAVGQTLDLTGMVVTASYKEDGVDDAATAAFTTSPADGYVFTAADAAAGTKTITITSTEDGEITTSLVVTVTPKIPTNLNRTATPSWTDTQTLAQGTGRWKAVFSDASEQTNIKIGDENTLLKIGGVEVNTSLLAKDYNGQSATLEFTAQGTTVSNTFTINVSAELSVDSFEDVPDYLIIDSEDANHSALVSVNYTSLNGEPEISIVSSNPTKLPLTFDENDNVYDSETKQGLAQFTITAGNTVGQYSVTVSATYGQRTESKSFSINVRGEAPATGTGAYQKATSLADLATGNYVIAVDAGSVYGMTRSLGSGKYSFSSALTVTNGSIATSDGDDISFYLSISGTGDSRTATIKNLANDNYVYYSGSTNVGEQASSYNWTITEATHGTFRLTSGTANRALIARTGTTNKFGGYSTTNVNGTEYFDIELFKYIEATTASSFDLVNDFVANYMHMSDVSLGNNNDTEACKGNSGYYLTAKRAWNDMVEAYEGSDNLEDVFEGSFEDAYARYMAWAVAMNDAGPFDGYDDIHSNIRASASYILGTSTESTNIIAIIAAISLLSVTAYGAYFFLRKKKEQ